MKSKLRFRNARWIWCSNEDSPVNAVANFRARILLKTITGTHLLLVSADNRFLVYINGKRAGYGPPRNYPENYQFEVIDVSKYLVKGENMIAVKVIHWGEGTFQALPGRAGLIAELMDAQGRSLVATNAGWKSRMDPSYRRDTSRIACQLGFEEQVEAQPGNWLESRCSEEEDDEEEWADSFEIGKAGIKPWGALRPSTIPPINR